MTQQAAIHQKQDMPFPAPIFVGGVPRSGTTLLRVMLDSHPDIHCGTELRVLNALATLWETVETYDGRLLAECYDLPSDALQQHFARLIRAFLEPAWRLSGKPRVAEKTPSNLLVFGQLARLFPGSYFVHVLRDGRDVVASRIERDLAQRAGERIDAVGLAAQRAREWVEGMRLRARYFSDPLVSPTYCEVRYEDLVRSPQATLQSLMARLGGSFDPAMLRYYEIDREVTGTEEWSAESVQRPVFEGSIGRWRSTLSGDQIAVVEDIAGEQLASLGYDRGDS